MRSAVIIAAALVAIAIVAATGLATYYSPYQSCVRALVADDYSAADAALACLQGIEPEDKSAPDYRPHTRTRSALAR